MKMEKIEFLDKKIPKYGIWKDMKRRVLEYLITEFECIVDVQNHEFGWVRSQNRIFLNY